MLSSLRSRSVFYASLIVLSAAVLVSGQAPPKKDIPGPAKKADQAPEKDRGQILAEIAVAREAFGKDPDKAESRFRLSQLLYQAGNFEESLVVLRPLLEAQRTPVNALLLAADLDYLFGRYESAEDILQRIVAGNPPDKAAQLKAQVKLMFVCYQTNRFEKAAGLFQGTEGKIKLPLLDLMRAFGRDKPFRADWADKSRRTVIPFIVKDPLPVIAVEVHGRQIYALIDTGADMFVLDSEIAASMGIKGLASTTGTFAGGKQAEVGFAELDSLKIGDVTLTSVPISLLPTQRFSKGFAIGKYTVGGIVGTGILKQFLSTLDYPNSRLILRRPDSRGIEELGREMAGKTTVEVPFVLALSHFMIARGRLNDTEPLTFFVDSGLASEAALTAPVQTLKYAGIPVPETKIQEGSIGGGGGAGFGTGLFAIRRLGLGPLVQVDKKGEFGSFPPGGYWMLGFIDDGIISHQFLREYAWTIEFSSMKMIFAK
ncbi:MAG: aspartyl protease family protein [Candidatus Aminicenantales bacterium]